MEQDPFRLRRTLDANGRAEWDQLMDLIEFTQISTGADKISWSLEPSGEYSVSSMYLALSRGGVGGPFQLYVGCQAPSKDSHLHLAIGAQPSPYSRGACPSSGAFGWAVCAVWRHRICQPPFLHFLFGEVRMECGSPDAGLQMEPLLLSTILSHPLNFCWQTSSFYLGFVCRPLLVSLESAQSTHLSGEGDPTTH
jgi:hypothetical protein